MSWNKALQIGGIIIIVVSIAAVAFLVYDAQFTVAYNSHSAGTDIFPLQSTSSLHPGVSILPVRTAVSSLSNPNQHSVQIAPGAGRESSMPQYFEPATLVIHTGDTVTWVNQDAVGHTVTSVAFNSGMINPSRGDSEKSGNNSTSTFSFKFTKSGIYSYFCEIHPYMSGTVYVDAQETQRQLVGTNEPGVENTMIEMPINTAYNNNYGPFYEPVNAIVASGSRVTWVNHDFIAHTATAGDRSFDSAVILPSTSKSLIVNGTNNERIGYFCEIHPWMQGSITIEAPKG